MDVGTNIYPNICFAYEVPEENIMNRQPRNYKTDRLCPGILYAYAYGFVGVFSSAGGLLTFWTIFSDYGFKPANLFFFISNQGITPSLNDYFNPYDNYKGNTIAFYNDNYNMLGFNGDSYTDYVSQSTRQVDFSSGADVWIDLRMFFYWRPNNFWGPCHFDSIGNYYDGPVCYHVEAVKHAQGGFLLALVTMQIINGLCSRTKISSSLVHKMKNMPLNSAYILEAALIVCLVNIPGFNTAFQIRVLRIEHYVPVLGMFIIYFTWEEFVKLLIRTVKNPDGSPGFFFKYFNY